MNAFSGEPETRITAVECTAVLDHKWSRESLVAKITI
jgi:hypothetical protein